MSESIFLLGDDGWLTEARSTAYQAEAELQELLAAIRAAGCPSSVRRACLTGRAGRLVAD
jgi:hypothetical protein